MSYDFSISSRKLFNESDFSPWVYEHMDNVSAFVQHVLGNNSESVREGEGIRRPSEEVHVHHHYHHSRWDYGWSGPWWGYGWGGPSYSPVTIYAGEGRGREKEEDHTGLAIASTVAFFVLSFFCGQAYYSYNAYGTQLEDHNNFMSEIAASSKKEKEQKDLGPLGHVNNLTKQLLEKKYNNAFINLALLTAGLSSALFIATGSIFKVAALRYSGLFMIFPIGGTALFRVGYYWNDDSDSKLAQKIEQALLEVRK